LSRRWGQGRGFFAAAGAIELGATTLGKTWPLICENFLKVKETHKVYLGKFLLWGNCTEIKPDTDLWQGLGYRVAKNVKKARIAKFALAAASHLGPVAKVKELAPNSSTD
jgi:hypothetical protein